MKKVIAAALLIMAAGTAFASGTAFAAGSVFQADDWTAKRKKTQEQWINTTDVKGPFPDNAEANNYDTINDVDRSFLVPFDDGSMMMVTAENYLQVRYLDKGYHQTGERNIKFELPLFGGNTSEPFVGGLHCMELDRHLYIRTGHLMYQSREEFRKRKDFTAVIFPASVTEIGNSAFEGCALTAVDIPGTVRKLDRYAFFACKSLTDVVLQEGVTELGEWSFCGITTKLRIVMPSTIKDFPGGVTENMAVWVVYKDGPAEAYAKGMNYKLEYR